MTRFFLFTYRYFKSRKLFFFGLMLALLAGAGFLAFQIEPEEDIRKMIPADDKIDQLNIVFENSKFTDKLILNISQADTSGTADPKLLIGIADSLYKIMEARYIPELIEEATYKVPPNMMSDVYNTFYNNLPLFLEEEDYTAIEALIDPANVRAKVENNYKTLVSPASVVLKKFIRKDPLGFTPLALKKLQSLEFDKNYQLHEGYIMTADKRNLSFFITPGISSQETSRNTEFYADLNQVLDSLTHSVNDSVSIYYFGASAVAVGNATQIKQDIRLTVSIAMIILIIFITWFFRKKAVFLALFVPVVFGASVSIALIFLFKGSISTIALGIGSVLLGIALDFSLHIFTHFRSTGSVEQTIRDLAKPLTMTSLTTASAFLCLMFVRSESLHELGMFAALAVICAAFFSLLILPHLLGKKPKKESGSETAHETFFDKIAAYQYHKNKYILLGILGLSILFLFTYKNAGFESDLNEMNYVTPELKEAEEKLGRINTYALKSVFLIASGSDMNDALEKNEKVIGKIKELQDQGMVEKFTSVNALLQSEAKQQEKIDRWNTFWTNARKDSVRSILINEGTEFNFSEAAFEEFYTLIEKDFKPISLDQFAELKDLFLKDYVSENPALTTVTTVLKVKPEYREEIFRIMDENEHVTILDKSYLTSRFIEVLKEDFNLLVQISLALVFLILLISFGNFELATITFIPMALSWLWTLGMMGILGIKFNIINIIISTFIFGLGIDYSIFVMQGLLQNYTYGLKNLNSYKTSILLSMVTTLAGVGVLVFATHPALKSIAMISVIGISSVVLISFTIEPILFNFLFQNRKEKGKIPWSFSALVRSMFAFLYFAGGCFVLTGFSIFLPLKHKKVMYIFHWLIMTYCDSLLKIMFIIKKVSHNISNETFEKPGVIICNHASFLDLISIQKIHPKMILLTNSWTYNSPVFGNVVRKAGYYHVNEGYEQAEEHLRKFVDDGYSIMVFPEGTRSVDSKIKRFHKGAFFLADHMKLDIIPVVLHGHGYCMQKGDDFYVKNSTVTIDILPRIKADDPSFGENYSQRTKLISKHFKKEYKRLSEEYEIPSYFRKRLTNNYRFKGSRLYWLVKSSVNAENYYNFLVSKLRRSGKITHLGSGYGFLTYLMNFSSEDREITAVEPDGEKVLLAQQCYSANDKVNFIEAPLLEAPLEEKDAYVLKGLEDYLQPEEQKNLLKSCIKNLAPGGQILIQESTYKRGKGLINGIANWTNKIALEKAAPPLDTLTCETIAKEFNCSFAIHKDPSGKTSEIFEITRSE